MHFSKARLYPLYLTRDNTRSISPSSSHHPSDLTQQLANQKLSAFRAPLRYQRIQHGEHPSSVPVATFSPLSYHTQLTMKAYLHSKPMTTKQSSSPPPSMQRHNSRFSNLSYFTTYKHSDCGLQAAQKSRGYVRLRITGAEKTTQEAGRRRKT